MLADKTDEMFYCSRR